MYHARLNTLKCMLMLMVLVMSTAANAGLFGIGGTSWREEVQLHDGSKFVADRTIVSGKGNRGFTYQHQTISFAMPVTGESILWEDQFSQDLGDSNFLPMLLDINRGIPYLVAKPMGCLSYNKWGRPNPPYVVFKYLDKVWTRIPLADLPVEINKTNLIFSQPDTEVKALGTRFVPAESIQKIISEYRQPEFRNILREPFATAAGGCTEMIHTNDGWEGLGLFRLKGTYEACVQYCVSRDVKQNCPCARLFKVGQ